MNQISALHNSHLSFYRTPFGAVSCGTEVVLRIKIESEIEPGYVALKYRKDGEEEKEIEMSYIEEQEGLKIYQIKLQVPAQPGLLWYYFLFKIEAATYFYGNNFHGYGGAGKLYNHIPPSYQITVFKEGATTPNWFKDAIMYQIFVDRFYNGSENEGVLAKKKNALLHLNWDDSPLYISDHKDKSGKVARWSFFGGNLPGVRQKLSYLKSLGISVIYFNPIFEAPSNHKYDTSDYHKIDPMFGDNAFFALLCKEAERLGMHVILDGVFSHTGSDSIYFNKEGNYDSLGAYQSSESPYYKWYCFKSCNEYECWWQIDTLPNVNEMEPSYQDFIIFNENSVLKYWLKKGAKGWRLDVVDELPDEFIKNFSKTMKEQDADSVLIGEVWEDASNKISYGKRREYLLGDEVDSVMNYPFRNIVLGFLTGQFDAQAAGLALMNLYENYPLHNFYSTMNLIGSHDVARALTVIKDALPEFVAEHGRYEIAAKRLKLGALWQMTFPGVPCIYYGDEAGLEGREDPHNRGTYPWGKENEDLLKFYKQITGIRNHYDVLKTGQWFPLDLHGDIFGYIRVIDNGQDVFGQKRSDNTAIILLNRSIDYETCISLNVASWKINKMYDILNDYTELNAEAGKLNINLKALEGKVLIADRWGSSSAAKRSCGVLLHVTSLPSKYGIGDLGENAYKFIDYLAAAKQKLWQVLPLNPPGYGESPYQCLSAFAGNPLIIDIDGLVDEGYLKQEALFEFPNFNEGQVEFDKVKHYKETLFNLAYAAFKNNKPEAYDDFLSENNYWLLDYALFSALKKHFQGLPWTEWEKSIAERQEHAIVYYQKLLSEDIEFEKFLQFMFYQQWQKLKKYANQKNIKIVGDIPIFVAHDSCDVWVNPNFFELDALGNPSKVAGVPPDYFSQYGQRWGNPLYKWQVMEEDDFKWWRDRFAHLYKLVDIIRIDHFRGFEQYWEIPAEEETAVNGSWVKGPDAKFFSTMQQYLGEVPVIAEDLGFITPGVEELRVKYGFPGMKILHFEMEGGGLNLPLNQKATVLYTGSHDNDTTVGWYREKFNDRIEGLHSSEEIAWYFIEMAYKSDAETVVIPLQDILSLGSEGRMNTPGTIGGNWLWRYTKDALSSNSIEQLASLTQKYKR